MADPPGLPRTGGRRGPRSPLAGPPGPRAVGRQGAGRVTDAWPARRGGSRDLALFDEWGETDRRAAAHAPRLESRLEFFQARNRYALHRAFRASNRCRFVFKILTEAHSVFGFTYTKDSMPIEQVYDLSEDAITSAKAGDVLAAPK